MSNLKCRSIVRTGVSDSIMQMVAIKKILEVKKESELS